MNILVLSQYFWPENFRINDLVTQLIKKGHKVTVLTGLPNYPNGNIFPEYQQSPKDFDEYQGANVIRVPLIPRGNSAVRLLLNYLSFMVTASIIGAWKLRGKKFDSIFVFCPSPITVGVPAIVLKYLKSASLTFWVLDLWPETLKAVGIVKSQWGLKLVGLFVRFVYKHCDAVLGQSKDHLPAISKYVKDSNKLHYFPNWAEDLYSETKSFAPEIEKKENTFNILFAGNIGQAQDFPAILDAAEELKSEKHIRWLIVGRGRMHEWVKTQVKERKLEDSFLLVGSFPVERMPEFYQHADCLLVTLKQDPFLSMTIPCKIQSYLAAGIPLLGMIDGAGATVIEEANAGFVASAGDGHQLASIVKEMSQLTPKERQTLGENGRDYAATQFNRTKLVENLENIFTRFN
jgi:colanic acid biosynthesis glycosyl transferase WcaI